MTTPTTPLPGRPHASILHLDLDAFFAAVEQRDKPSLRGRPVVVGGTGGRGVVATASYEARAFGVRSAMSTREARARCPHAAYLGGRFEVYREASRAVMTLLRSVTPLVEPLSLDEAFIDLEGAEHPLLPDLSTTSVHRFAEHLRTRVSEVTEGLTASVGAAPSKLLAKIASDLDKPDGLVVVAPGTEVELLRPMAVTVIPGVGPATAERLRRAGVHTVGDLERMTRPELVDQFGRAQGPWLHDLARARDRRAVIAEREAKSVSSEGTYERDLTDPSLMAHRLTRQAEGVAERLRRGGLSGRTVSIKVRRADFTTLSRSATLASPVDDGAAIARVARGLLTELLGTGELAGGVRLLGVGVSGLADWVQDELFALGEPAAVPVRSEGGAESPSGDHAGAAGAVLDETVVIDEQPSTAWRAGADVEHDEHGRGWVWGAGRSVVTVRFETRHTPPGPVRSFDLDDPALHAWRPAPPPDDEPPHDAAGGEPRTTSVEPPG